MAFDEVQFPTDISLGSRGGPGFNTTILTSDSGLETRISRWQSSRRQYDVSYGVKNRIQYSALQRFYIARRGAATGFRYKDWLDYSSNPDGFTAPSDTDQQIGIGDGSKVQFRLKKEYESGLTVVQRVIGKPVSGTTIISIDDVSQASGWTVNTTSGIVTFTTAPSLGEIIKAGFEFDVPARFGKQADEALLASVDEFDVINLSSIPIVEDPNPEEIDDELYNGGAKSWGTTSVDISITRLHGRVQTFAPTAQINVNLPSLAGIPNGAIVFWLNNDGSEDIVIRDTLTVNSLGEGEDFAVLVTIAPGQRGLFSVGPDPNENKVWYWIVQ